MLKKPTILDFAIEEANRLQSDSRWVELRIINPNLIHMSWGAIHSNGDWEIPIASRTFEQRDSAVKIGPVLAHA